MTFDEVKPFVAAKMNLLPFVVWDRFVVNVEEPEGDTSDEALAAAKVSSLLAYGWISRMDGRSDFVLLEFADRWGWDTCSATTSSAQRSEQIQKTLHGPMAEHYPCQRVEHAFAGLVKHATSAMDVHVHAQHPR